MKKIILLLLLWIILFNRCDSDLPIIGKKEKESTYSKVTQMCYFTALLGGPSGYKVVDNNDGTVALVNYSSLGVDGCPPPFGKIESILSIKYYIKKCIQGQVYRQAQNDCKGTGTAANYYGAQKLQMCPTNSSCTKSVSPVVTSCKNESIGNRTWVPKSFWDFTSEYIALINYYKSRSDEIPAALTDFYWDYFPGLSFANIDGSLSSNSAFYTDFTYVLCFQNKS